MAPIRVLQVMPAMDAGGMETFVMNVYRTIDREKVQFDFLYHYDKPCFFDDEIRALGGRIFKLTVRQDNNLPRYLRELRALFAAHPEWRIIHGHYSGFGMFYNPAARRAGIHVRCGHSHNTAYERNFVGRLDHFMSSFFNIGLTDRFACSEKAGQMLFGKHPFTVVPNGIDTARFAARDPQRRALLRGELGVTDQEILFGHVGRFSDQKNHPGLLKIFAAVRTRLPKARLVLLGGGDPAYVEKMQTLAAELGLGDSVIFAGVRSNIQSFYDAMDAFLLPSLFEGLPVVLVEAQTAGLPCFVADTVEELHKLGWTYEKEGALWLKTAEIMREQYRKQGKKDEDIDKLDLKDDVLRRANGFYTYFAGDIAYHRNKFAVRHFDKVINIWGADHHGHVARMKGAMDALGLDGTNRLDIVLMQLVKLVRDGEVVRMSKRTGKTISLSDLLDEIPVDACRYFFNAKPDTQMEFDLGLAVREDSENPIYYIQYAHARICSLLKALEEEGHSVKSGAVDLSILSSESERALIKELSSFAEEIRMAARDYDPSYINRYLMRLAAAFHKFYNACRIKGEDEAVIDARLKLAAATRQVLANGLQVIGCSAPEKM